MTRKYKYDYYRVEIPGDLSDNMDDLYHAALVLARERAKLECTICIWSVILISGTVGSVKVIFRVTRKRTNQEVPMPFESLKNRRFKVKRKLDMRRTGGPLLPKGTLGTVLIVRATGELWVKLDKFDTRHLLPTDIIPLPVGVVG